mmetsp:Transcript_6090/g.13876  ORF Transcript_6090/g.13876 Transcript_6090/m.13876 type:complete len:220 (-) Transcript_6090:3102-3761(-)
MRVKSSSLNPRSAMASLNPGSSASQFSGGTSSSSMKPSSCSEFTAAPGTGAAAPATCGDSGVSSSGRLGACASSRVGERRRGACSGLAWPSSASSIACSGSSGSSSSRRCSCASLSSSGQSTRSLVPLCIGVKPVNVRSPASCVAAPGEGEAAASLSLAALGLSVKSGFALCRDAPADEARSGLVDGSTADGCAGCGSGGAISDDQASWLLPVSGVSGS